MKKQLLSLLFVLVCTIFNTSMLLAQNPYEDVIYPYANDSLVYERYDQGTWSVYNKQVYGLYPDRRPDFSKIYQANSTVPFLFDYLWDGSNKLVGYDLKFNFGGQLININELRLIRNAQGNVVEEILQELDQPGSPLVNNERVLYSYDAQNRLISEISQNWDDNQTPAAWLNDKKSVYMYDGTGKRVTQLDSFWTTNNVYTFGTKYTFEYNANGKVSLQIHKNELDVETGKTTYTYNSAGILIEEKYESKDGANYQLVNRDSIVVDANNRIAEEYVYSMDFSVNKVIMTGRMKSLGSAVGIFSNSKLFKQLIAFPNPTNGVLNLELKGESDKNVEVYNLLGEKVLSVTLLTTSNSIDLSGLTNGIYTVKVKSNEGEFQNKVILSK